MQMKINKSILGIAVMVIVLFSACSQSRYGNLTRRTKASHLVKEEVKKEHKTVKKEEVKLEELVVAKTNTKLKEVTSEIDMVEPISSPTDAIFVADVKEGKKKEAFTDAIPFKGKKAKKVSKMVKQLDQKLDITKDSSDESLIRTVLIIILILLLISLVLSLLPQPLKYIVSLVLTILLILYLIQMLS
jgi:Flp pilus assembly protein TadB